MKKPFFVSADNELNDNDWVEAIVAEVMKLIVESGALDESEKEDEV